MVSNQSLWVTPGCAPDVQQERGQWWVAALPHINPPLQINKNGFTFSRTSSLIIKSVIMWCPKLWGHLSFHFTGISVFIYSFKINLCNKINSVHLTPSLLEPNPRLLSFFQNCCLCNLRGGAFKRTVDNWLVAHTWFLKLLFTQRGCGTERANHYHVFLDCSVIHRRKHGKIKIDFSFLRKSAMTDVVLLLWHLLIFTWFWWRLSLSVCH